MQPIKVSMNVPLPKKSQVESPAENTIESDKVSIEYVFSTS